MGMKMMKFPVKIRTVMAGCSFLFAASFLTALPSNTLVPAGSWVYDYMLSVAHECGEVSFAQCAPLSVEELKSYLLELDTSKLSSAGRRQYHDLMSYFTDNSRFMVNTGAIALSGEVKFTPELYYKSNEDIDWSFRYFYKDNILSAPVIIDTANTFTIETDLFLGKNYWAIKDSGNWTNLQLDSNDMEFLWPKTAYLSVGHKIFGKSCFNFQIGKGGMSIGDSETGSVILSPDFETEGYAQLSFYSPQIRYTGDVIQVDVNRYLYLHRVDLRPFKCIQLGTIEGTYINAPFEIRYLNPLMIMHSTTPWIGYDDYNETAADGKEKYYGESRVCAYLAFTLDWAITKNVRMFGLFAQNEIQMPGEKDSLRGKMFPDGIGGQLGFEVKIPVKTEGYWYAGMEGLYTTPWLYIKHDADWSLYRRRYDNLMHTAWPINTWIGTQFGPDTIAGQIRGGYEKPGEWKLEGLYRFAVQGENSFNLFNNPDGTTTAVDGHYHYYPVAGYDSGYYTADEAIALAEETTPTGIPQYTHRIQVQGSYKVLQWLEVSGRTGYAFIANCNHIEGNFQHGIEFAVSASFTLR